MDFNNLLVAGIPLMIVVFGLVEFIKSFGLKGWLVTLLSLLIGLALGIGYQIARAGLPVDFAGWFSDVIFGLAIGLVASGFYKFLNDRIPKVQG